MKDIKNGKECQILVSFVTTLSYISTFLPVKACLEKLMKTIKIFSKTKNAFSSNQN